MGPCPWLACSGSVVGPVWAAQGGCVGLERERMCGSREGKAVRQFGSDNGDP